VTPRRPLFANTPYARAVTTASSRRSFYQPTPTRMSSTPARLSVKNGIKNLGQTCYMGSVLTMHMHLPLFKGAVYKGGGGSVVGEMRMLFQDKDAVRVGIYNVGFNLKSTRVHSKMNLVRSRRNSAGMIKKTHTSSSGLYLQ
jgi:hypothetical protein